MMIFYRDLMLIVCLPKDTAMSFPAKSSISQLPANSPGENLQLRTAPAAAAASPEHPEGPKHGDGVSRTNVAVVIHKKVVVHLQKMENYEKFKGPDNPTCSC